MASKKKGLLGGLFGSGPKKEKKLTEEELRDKELVEEFYDKGLDLKELDKYKREAVEADQVLHKDENFKAVKGAVYVISLKPFYDCIGTRTGRLADGLVDLCYKVMREKVGDRGTFSQQTEDLFIFQFKDGVTPQNWKIAIESINEIGTTFLGSNYNPKEIIDTALGQGDAEDLLSDDFEDALAAALQTVTIDGGGRVKIATGPANPQPQTKTVSKPAGEMKRALPDPEITKNWKEKDWEAFHAGADPQEAQMIKVGKDRKEQDPQWQRMGEDKEPEEKWTGVNTFRPKSKWVQRNGERRKKQMALQMADRRRKKHGRRVEDDNEAVVWR